MKEQALFCDGTASYVNPPQPAENETITLRFRTAKDDVDPVSYTHLDLHVNRLSLEKGEVDLSGNIDSVAYSDVQAHGKQQENIFSKLFR